MVAISLIEERPNVSMDISVVPTNESNIRRSKHLIQVVGIASMIEEGSTSYGNIPLVINTIRTSLLPID